MKTPNSINATGSSSMLPLLTSYSLSYEQADVNVSAGGSGHGLEAISKGNADIGNMSSNEQSSIVGTNYQNDWQSNRIRTVTVAIDAIAIVVNLPNNVRILNNAKPIVKISELGLLYDLNDRDDPTWGEMLFNPDPTSTGLNTPVQAFGRAGGKAASGTSDGFFSTLAKHVSNPSNLDLNHTSPKIRTTQEANSAAFRSLNSSDQGLTYLSLGYALSAENDPISRSKVAQVEGLPSPNNPNDPTPVDPTIENAKTGDYAWTRPYNSAFSENAPQFVKDFILWMLNVSLDPNSPAAVGAHNAKYGAFQVLFNDANCIPLDQAMVQWQIATLSQSDFELYDSNIPGTGTAPGSRDLAFGLNLAFEWKNATPPPSAGS